MSSKSQELINGEYGEIVLIQDGLRGIARTMEHSSGDDINDLGYSIEVIANRLQDQVNNLYGKLGGES